MIDYTLEGVSGVNWESSGPLSIKDCLGNNIVVGSYLSSDRDPSKPPTSAVIDILGPDYVLLNHINVGEIRLQVFSATSWVLSNSQKIEGAFIKFPLVLSKSK